MRSPLNITRQLILCPLLCKRHHGNRYMCTRKEESGIPIIARTESMDQQLEQWEKAVNVLALSDLELEIHKSHLLAVKCRQETYIDPLSGFMVFSIYGHLLRGSCCGRACRHCPYRHENAPLSQRKQMRFNSAFYVK